MQSDRTLTRQVDQLGRTRVDLNGRTGVDQLARTERATCAPSGWTSLAELQVDLIRRAVTPSASTLGRLRSTAELRPHLWSGEGSDGERFGPRRERDRGQVFRGSPTARISSTRYATSSWNSSAAPRSSPPRGDARPCPHETANKQPHLHRGKLLASCATT